MMYKTSALTTAKPVQAEQCLKNPCKNGGQCIHAHNGKKYICLCPERFEGTNCDKKIKTICDKNPCQHGGNCNLMRGADGTLIMTQFKCQCVQGYSGDACQYHPLCNNSKCTHNAKCVPEPEKQSYTCKCPSGYFGDFCNNSKSCKSVKCGVEEVCIVTDADGKCLIESLKKL